MSARGSNGAPSIEQLRATIAQIETEDGDASHRQGVLAGLIVRALADAAIGVEGSGAVERLEAEQQQLAQRRAQIGVALPELRSRLATAERDAADAAWRAAAARHDAAGAQVAADIVAAFQREVPALAKLIRRYGELQRERSELAERAGALGLRAEMPEPLDRRLPTEILQELLAIRLGVLRPGAAISIASPGV